MAGRLGLVSLAVVAVLALGVTVACAANSDRSLARDFDGLYYIDFLYSLIPTPVHIVNARRKELSSL